MAVPFAPKCSVADVLAATAVDTHMRLPSGLVCDRVWLQGVVCKVMTKRVIAFWLADGWGPGLPSIRVRSNVEAVPAVGDCGGVIGRVGIVRAAPAATAAVSSDGAGTSQGSSDLAAAAALAASAPQQITVVLHKVSCAV
jgi:hypothetical protein